MPANLKKYFHILIISALLTAGATAALRKFPVLQNLRWKIYDELLKFEVTHRPAPAKIKDILIVGIDNETLSKVPERWPYPRAYFAKVVNNLLGAGAKVIAFDFIFLGKSTYSDDQALKEALEKSKNIVLASAINEEGFIELSSNLALSKNVESGIITKIQDDGGAIRRCLTYLVNDKNPNQGYLSWEMQILRTIHGIDLNSLASKDNSISSCDPQGQEWEIPVDKDTKSFLIHFRGYTKDFNRLSFYRAWLGEFDPRQVKDKIVLIGVSSSLFGDLHYTSIGWLPGITLNANAFLGLYSHDFLRELPKIWEYLILACAILLSIFLASTFRPKTVLLLMALPAGAYLLLSYCLLLNGYTMDYALFIFAALVCPFLAKKICLL